MVRSNRVALVLTALVALGPAFTGLEARTQDLQNTSAETVTATSIQSQQQVEGDAEFSKYMARAEELDDIRRAANRARRKIPYEQFEEFFEKIFSRYEMPPLSSSEVARSDNLLIAFIPNEKRIFVQCTTQLKGKSVGDFSIFEDYILIGSMDGKSPVKIRYDRVKAP